MMNYDTSYLRQSKKIENHLHLPLKLDLASVSKQDINQILIINKNQFYPHKIFSEKQNINLIFIHFCYKFEKILYLLTVIYFEYILIQKNIYLFHYSPLCFIIISRSVFNVPETWGKVKQKQSLTKVKIKQVSSSFLIASPRLIVK